MRIYSPEQLQKLLLELKDSYNKSQSGPFLYRPILTSGFYDPLHEGHIACFEHSVRYGNIWIALVNNNEALIKKKGYYLLDENIRAAVVSNLRYVHYTIIWPEADIAGAIELLKPSVLCKGGDRTPDNLNKMEEIACRSVGCKVITGVGGINKPNSSSKIIESFLERHSKVHNSTMGNK